MGVPVLAVIIVLVCLNLAVLLYFLNGFYFAGATFTVAVDLAGLVAATSDLIIQSPKAVTSEAVKKPMERVDTDAEMSRTEIHNSPRPEIRISEIPDISGSVAALGLGTTLRLDYLESKIRNVIDTTSCELKGTAEDRAFVCKTDNQVPDISSCTFRWPLNPVIDASSGDLIKIEGRATVISNPFSKGGYGIKGSATNTSLPSKVGVAIVSCAPKGSAFRSAFVLSNETQIRKYKSLFRTVGYDWTSRALIDTPYLREIFAMSSLRGISRLIQNVGKPLVANNGDELFDTDSVDALKAFGARELTVGNNSDFGLGVSRGACVLAAQATTSGSAKVDVAPTEIIEQYHSLTPTVINKTSEGTLRSIPCPLLISWYSLSAEPKRMLPKNYTIPQITYLAYPNFQRESLWRAYALRSAAVMLYMLGFQVMKPTDEATEEIKGQWPRENLRSQ
jgi:hypothetical protein